MRGWGPGLRKAIARWYLEKPTDKLAYQLVKYQNREGWSHRDVLRVAHVPSQSTLMRWVIGADAGTREVKNGPKGSEKVRVYGPALGALPELVAAFEEAKTDDEKAVVKLIRDRGLTREMIPTEMQKSPAIWEALLEKMPLTAMIRSLGRMGACGLLAPLSEASKLVQIRLTDSEYLHKSRVHPIQVLSALLTYGQGHGQKGKLAWQPVPTVVDALNDAFYAAFQNVPPTGKRFYLGIDVSGSMTGGVVAGIAGLTPNMGAAAMAMLIARTEPNYFIGGFATSFIDLGVSKSDRLDVAMRKCQRDFGGTDCAVAINHALAKKYPVDAFVVITDGMTWAGDVHASQAIVEYRRKTGVDAKLIVINMVAERTKLTDPQDAGSLDVVGFDASVPTVIAGFMGANGPQSDQSDSE
jgi:60 kDa SS-A/Ro ribonucleoprotein